MGSHTISDHDVSSYYPSMILLLKMFPAQLGPAFLEIYQAIYDARMLAKRAVPKLKSRLEELKKMLAEHDEKAAKG